MEAALKCFFSHSEFTPSGKLLAGILVKNQPKVRKKAEVSGSSKPTLIAQTEER